MNFVHCKNTELCCKTRNDLKSITTSSGAVPKVRRIVAVLSQQRTVFELMPYGIYGGKIVGFYPNTSVFPCQYHFTNAPHSVSCPRYCGILAIYSSLNHTQSFQGLKQIHEATANLQRATNMYTTNTQFICGFYHNFRRKEFNTILNSIEQFF